MAKLDESVRILHFEADELPSHDEFSSSIEPKNVPAVFRGAVKNWEAISKWDPANGGLDYLEEKAGSIHVDAMLSSSAPVFYGDVRSHERVSLPFTTFTTLCKLHVQNVGIATSCSVGQDDSVSKVNSEASCSVILDTPEQLYLAQVPILSTESKEKSPLEILRNDIQTPVFLDAKAISSINLWMNKSQSRSSTHYDPYHNLLCIVAGSKQVVLWPPSACPFLYPMPIHGESSNHSAVDLENPDLSVHSRAKHSMEYSQMVILKAGDALFIPEGWFHQVDSGDLTIAVNFWWKSYIMSNMLQHMDAYYLRRLLNRLVGKEMDFVVQKGSVDHLEGTGSCKRTDEASKGCYQFVDSQADDISRGMEKHGMLQQLEPFAVNMLYELISSVHASVKISDQNEDVECTTLRDSSFSLEGEHKRIAVDSSLLELDKVASIFSVAEPLVLKKVLLTMVHYFPRTLETLILHVLSPIAAEVLTRKFDQMDQKTTKDEQREYYQLFYSVFDDPNAAMGAILKGKESFAFQAVQRVLDQYLGLYIDRVN